jgi:hypothetical protein
MKKILIFQWFDCKDEQRRAELRACAAHNLRLQFDETIILNDSVEPEFFGERVTNVRSSGRITYKTFVDIANDPKNHGSLVVLTNSDIQLADDFQGVASVIQPGDFFCFTRYESSHGRLADYPWCTQDVWAMIAQPIHNSVIFQSEIPLGRPGCEIRFAEIMFSAGFSVFNPCLDVRNMHVHSNQAKHRDEDRIYGAYLFTPATSLSTVQRRDAKERPMPCYLTNFIKNRLFPIPLA